MSRRDRIGYAAMKKKGNKANKKSNQAFSSKPNE
jgi:hypothetical protein